MTRRAAGCDIFTDEKFGDIHLELEFMVPKGSNSGIYLMGEYEVQILDSYGKPDDKLAPGRHRRHLQRRGPEEERREEAGRVAEVRHRLPGAEVRGRQEDRQRQVRQGELNDVVIARERRDEAANPRRADRQGSGDRAADVPGRPRRGRVPEYQDHAEEVRQRRGQA